jgi:hypothetical protein
METPARDLRGRLSVGGAEAKTSALAVLRGPIRRRPYNRGKIIAMKRGELIVIYRLLVTGQSGMHGPNPASPRGTGADTGMGGQWLAQPLWANIANLDPTLTHGRLLALLEGTAQALPVERDVAAVGLAGPEQRLEKTHERFSVRWTVKAILPSDGDKLMTRTAPPSLAAVSWLVHCPQAPLYSRLIHCPLPERCACCTACCSL